MTWGCPFAYKKNGLGFKESLGNSVLIRTEYLRKAEVLCFPRIPSATAGSVGPNGTIVRQTVVELPQGQGDVKSVEGLRTFLLGTVALLHRISTHFAGGMR